MKQKNIPEHKDKLGRLLNTGDCVAYPDGNHLSIGVIKKLNPVMIKVSLIGPKRSRWDPGDRNKYSYDCVKLDGPDVTMWLLRQELT